MLCFRLSGLWSEEYENQKRKDVNFAVGQKVFLNTRNLSGIHFKRKEEKFYERYCGPFTIVERVGTYTYKLELPKSMSRLHPVFHVVALLHRAVDNPPDFQHRKEPSKVREDQNIPETEKTLMDEEGRPCFIIEKVVGRRPDGGKPGRRDYLVKWQGFDACENTYISRHDVASGGALQLMKYYDAAMSLAEVSK